MDRFDRIYALHHLLISARHPVPLQRVMDALECSRATATRVIHNMRLYLDAPIVWDRARNGYRYDQQGEHPWELPGLWFNASELYALLASQRLLAEVQPGLLDAHLAPLRRRIEEMLENERLAPGDIAERVRILRMGGRRGSPRHFGTVAGALLRRRRLHIVYHGRARDAVTERSVSPQRLVHYRDNWYLDAWCHVAGDLRSFAVERIQRVHTERRRAREIDAARLDAHFATAYGIFAGRPRAIAVLRFAPERARWVAEEQWHPEQQGEFLDDGCYELRLPYGDARELVMDVLRYGPEVEVVAPAALREQVAARLEQALGQYRGGGPRAGRRKPRPRKG